MLFVGLFSVAAGLFSQAPPIDAELVRVLDGDSIRVDLGARVVDIRIAEIDTPETRQNQPFAEASMRYLEEILGCHSLKIHDTGKRTYGRWVARVEREDGLDVGAELVSEGLAWVYCDLEDRKPCYPHRAELVELQAMAQRAGLNLWSGECPVPPWEWRRLRSRRKALEECERIREMEASLGAAVREDNPQLPGWAFWSVQAAGWVATYLDIDSTRDLHAICESRPDARCREVNPVLDWLGEEAVAPALVAHAGVLTWKAVRERRRPRGDRMLTWGPQVANAGTHLVAYALNSRELDEARLVE